MTIKRVSMATDMAADIEIVRDRIQEVRKLATRIELVSSDYYKQQAAIIESEMLAITTLSDYDLIKTIRTRITNLLDEYGNIPAWPHTTNKETVWQLICLFQFIEYTTANIDLEQLPTTDEADPEFDTTYEYREYLSISETETNNPYDEYIEY